MLGTVELVRQRVSRLKEVIERLAPLCCSNCGYYRSEHHIWCPKSGRTRKFKPGGIPDIPNEILDLLLETK